MLENEFVVRDQRQRSRSYNLGDMPIVAETVSQRRHQDSDDQQFWFRWHERDAGDAEALAADERDKPFALGHNWPP